MINDYITPTARVSYYHPTKNPKTLTTARILIFAMFPILFLTIVYTVLIDSQASLKEYEMHFAFKPVSARITPFVPAPKLATDLAN